MSIEVYEDITRNRNTSLNESREELYRLLAEGHKDVVEGRTRPAADVFADVRKAIADGTL
jgi:hypothetical protein